MSSFLRCLCAYLMLAVLCAVSAETESVEFDIDAQDLAPALREFSRQSQTQLLYAPGDVAGKQSAAVRGSYAPIDALKRLVAEADLVIEQAGGGALTLKPPPTSPAIAAINPAAPPRPTIMLVDELTVSAPRRDKPVGELPMSVSVLSGDELEARLASGVADVANWIPNMQLSSQSPQFSSYVIRGLKGTSVGGRTIDFLIDGATAGDIFNASAPALLDYERLEVIRGSQGIFYGASSLGGTIKLVSVKPQLDRLETNFGGSAWSTEDGADSWRGDAIVNVPLVTDRLAARFGASYEDRGGFVDTYTADPMTLLPDQLLGKDVNTVERRAYRAAAAWQATDRFEIYLTGRFQSMTTPFAQSESMRRDPPGGDSLEPAGDFQLTSGIAEYRKQPERDEAIATLEAAYAFTRAKLIFETTYYASEIETDARQEFNTPNGVVTASFVINEDQTNRSHELRLLSRDDDKLEWIVGAYWRDEAFDQFLESVQPAFNVTSTSAETLDRTQASVFGNVKYRLFERLALELGLRFLREDLDRFRRTATQIGPMTSPPTIVSGDDTFDNLAPRFAVSFDVSDDAFVYGSVSKGFRGGAINLSANVDLPDNLKSSRPDKNWTYEVGLKGRWLDDRVAGSLAAFYNDWRDIQVRVFRDVNGTLASLAVNGDTASSIGLEGELTWLPADWLRLTLSGHYMETELESSIRGQQANTIADIRAGNELTDAPKYGVAMTVDAARALSATWLGYARVDLLARAGSFSDLNNAPVSKTDAYQLGDIRVGVRSQRWDLSLFAQNMWNERAHTFQQTNFASPAAGLADVISPRRTGFAARFSF
ncbi:MAG: TonB-dependent receptor domain-containing protein [Gammaproteobacteria bacterium]